MTFTIHGSRNSRLIFEGFVVWFLLDYNLRAANCPVHMIINYYFKRSVSVF